MLKVQGFGKLRLGHRQTVLDHFPTQQVEELLGFLLLQPQTRHTRERLITLLWPQVTVAQGRHRFSVVLSRLRQMFKQLQTPFVHYIETTRAWVAFAPQRPFSFDRDQFVATCQLGFRTESLEKKEQQLETAVGLYRADLMAGIYADWCLAEREYLARLRLRALGQLMHCCMQRQAYPAAIEHGHAILQDDPLREQAHRALMRCYVAQGRHDLAARQYETCFDLLRTELNELPLPATIGLYQEIMATRARAALIAIGDAAHKVELRTAVDAFHRAARRLNNFLS